MSKRRRPTSTEVARRAGVSRSTVSFVLNDVSDIAISEATRERVLEAIGRRAGRILLDMIQGTRPQERNAVLAVQFIPRESSCPTP